MADPYRRIARIYDAVVEPFNGALRRYVLKVVRPEPGTRVLEVGCGTGTNLGLFSAAGCRVSGIDLSPSMIGIAKEKLGKEADLRLGDASDMPFSNGSFDLVVAFLTLHEMPTEVRNPVIREMTRVTAPAGRMLFIDYHPGPFRFPKGWFYRSIIYSIEFGAGWEHFQNHRDFLDRRGLPILIEEHDLRIDKEKILAGGNIQVVVTRPAP